jgi:hypothetical protein
MTAPLLPCSKCGSDEHPFAHRPKGQRSYRAALRCRRCGFTSGKAFGDEAMELTWNADVRAYLERTTHVR